MELHFYPGRKKLVVKEGDKITWRFDAWGGPNTPGTDTYMQEMPTTAGTYIIDSVGPYITPSWKMSQIKWGTKLQDKKKIKDVWYLLPSRKWGSIVNDFGINRNDILRAHEALYGREKVPRKWIFNDFGPLTIRYFIDKNHNKKLDKNKGEKLSGEMIHTTPLNEMQTNTGEKVELGLSHGCIHIKPRDRNTLLGLQAFKKGTTFVVHKYDEKIE